MAWKTRRRAWSTYFCTSTFIFLNEIFKSSWYSTKHGKHTSCCMLSWVAYEYTSNHFIQILQKLGHLGSSVGQRIVDKSFDSCPHLTCFALAQTDHASELARARVSPNWRLWSLTSQYSGLVFAFETSENCEIIVLQLGWFYTAFEKGFVLYWMALVVPKPALFIWLWTTRIFWFDRIYYERL